MRRNKNPDIIPNGSKQPFISLGVKFGKIWINGKEYVYLQEFDAFIRRDKINIFKNRLEIKKNTVSLDDLIKKISYDTKN